jgi:hypothetical protein
MGLAKRIIRSLVGEREQSIRRGLGAGNIDPGSNRDAGAAPKALTVIGLFAE